MTPPATPRRGFALMAALALLVTISVVALDLSVIARPRRLAAAAAAEHLAMTEAASGGVEHALARLQQLDALRSDDGRVDPARALDPWASANRVVIGPTAIGAFMYRVELRDAFARLHVNGASEDRLRRLFLALRVDARRADRLAQAIADWRDGDQLRRANGAERNEYLRAGRPMLPDDAPFPTVAALRFVLGMTDSLYEAVAPYLTEAGDGGVNLNAAPRPVLLALPGMTEEAVSLILRDRASGRRITDLIRFAQRLSAGARRELAGAMPQLRNIVVLETQEMHVVSEAWQPPSSARIRVDAVISREAGGRVIWRRVTP